jgi:hypothetical protein
MRIARIEEMLITRISRGGTSIFVWNAFPLFNEKGVGILV